MTDGQSIAGAPPTGTGAARLNRCDSRGVGARTTGRSAEGLPRCSRYAFEWRACPLAGHDLYGMLTTTARGMRGHAGLVRKFPACVGLPHVGVQPSDEVLEENVLRRPRELAVVGLVDDVPAAGGGDDRLHGPGEDGRGLAAIPVQEVRRRLRIIDFGLCSSTQPAGEMCESMSLITTMVSAIAESPIPGRTKGSRGD